MTPDQEAWAEALRIDEVYEGLALPWAEVRIVSLGMAGKEDQLERSQKSRLGWKQLGTAHLTQLGQEPS